jgi:hypothetical protein
VPAKGYFAILRLYARTQAAIGLAIEEHSGGIRATIILDV